MRGGLACLRGDAPAGPAARALIRPIKQWPPRGETGAALGRRVTPALVAAGVVLLASLALGQQTPVEGQAPVEAPASAFRRMFVPQDALEPHIRGLLPLKREAFEQRLKETAAFATRDQPSAATLVRLRLVARVEQQDLREGVAELELRLDGPQPALIVLDPWNLPLTSALWKSPAIRPAVLGRDPTGRLCCLVPHSGVLELGWSQRAREAQEDLLQFDLSLPPAAQRQIELRVPQGWSVTANSGLVSRPQPTERIDGQRWVIDLGGESTLQLALMRPGGTAGRPRVWRENSRYTLYRGTFDLESTWQWEAPAPLASGSELRFGLPAGLRVAALRLGEQAATWSLQTDAHSGQPLLVVSLPSEAQAGTLTVSASGDWPSQGTFLLPRIVPREGVYQEGQVELFSEPWLQVQPKVARGGVRVAAGPAAPVGSRGLDRFAMQLFEPDAQVEVTASPSFAPLHVQSATQLLVETGQVLAVATAEVTVPTGERFALEAQVPRPWVVDAVDVQPPEMLAERALTAQGSGPQRLRLQLARPLVAGRPLRVTLRAHFRRPPPGQPLAEGCLQPLGFPDAFSLKRWIAVRVDDTAAELRLDDDERLRRIEEKDLTPAERQLFEQPPSGLLLTTSDPAATARLTLEAATGRYNAELVLRVEAGRRQVQHTLKLQCTPQGAALGSVLVRLVPPPKENVIWHLTGDARELTAIPEPAVNPQAGQAAEVWRVPLPRPRNSPLELTAQWTSPLGATHEVPLASLPDATLTTAVVEVHARDGQWAMQTRHLEPLPPLPPNSGEYSTLAGRFRYAAGQQPQLVLARAMPHPGDARAWVESLWLTSRWTPDGRGEHEAQLLVRNLGRDELRLILPRDVQEPSWHVVASDASTREAASAELSTPATPSPSGDMVIPLPDLKARVTVVLRYRTTHRSLARWPWRTWQVPLPSVDLPVLKRGWTILIPSEWAVWSAQKLPEHARAPTAPPLAQAQGVSSSVPPPSQTVPPAATAGRPVYLLWLVLSGPGWLAEACKGLVALPPATPDPLFAGWQQLTLPVPDGPQAEVSVYRVSWAAAWAWAWACAAAAWGWRRRGRFSTTLAIASFALFLASIDKHPLSWWFAGAGFGALAGGLLALAWPRGTSTAAPAGEHPSGASSLEQGGLSRRGLQPVSPAGWLWLGCGVGLALGLAGWGIWASRLLAQENMLSKSPKWRVVVPVDEQGQPAGDYVYLDPGLYERLHRRDGRQPGELPPWLVLKARYELAHFPTSAETGGDSSTIAIPQMRVLLDLETFQPDARVLLPWRQEEVTLHPGTSRLDGQPAALAWEPDGRGLAVRVAQPGRHQLSLTLAARARRVGDVVQLDLSVPPAAIEEWAESGADVPEGRSVASTAPEQGQPVQFLSLGPGRVRWQWSADAQPGVSTLAEAEQLLWWKIRRGSVSLEARFRVRGLRPGPRTLTIEVDPRLRLVSGLSLGPIRRVHSDPVIPHRVQVDCEVPASGELSWQMAWLWPQTSGSGRLPLPKVRLSQVRLRRDWTAISVEPPLEWVRSAAGRPSAGEPAAAPSSAPRSAAASGGSDRGEASEPLGTPTPAAFLTAWGDQETAPLAVFATSAAELDEPLVIRPGRTSPSAEVEQDWSIGAAAANVVLQAHLSGTAGRFDYRLTWPAAVRVQRVVLSQGGRPVAIRWTQPAEGTLLVTLLEPPAADTELYVEGTLTLPAQRARFVLPLVRLDDVHDQELRVRVYRQREVLLELPAAAGWETLVESPVGSFRSERGWLVAVLRRVDERSRPLQVERKSHRPKLVGHLLVRVRPEAGGWQAQALLDLEVQEGVLDELRLSVPAAFSGQLRLDPAWESRLEPSAAASRRLWIVRPPVSLTGKVQLKLQGRIDPAAGGIQVPDISLADTAQVARWVLLEPGTPDEPIVWQPRGLVAVRPQEVPAAASAWQTQQGQWYRVVGRRFEATARLRQQEDASPRCLLAEYAVTPVAPRHGATRATFTILPADTRPIVLSLPPGQRLLQVLVEGVASVPVPLGPRRWQIAAPSDLLPYQLTVLVDGLGPTAEPPGTRATWSLPELVDLPAAAWLITVRGPWADLPWGGAGWHVDVETAQTCSADEAALVQIETLARCLEEVSLAQSRDVPGGIVHTTLRRWLAPLEHALAVFGPTGPSDDRERSEHQERLQTRLEAVRQLVAAIKTRSGLADAASADAPQDDRPAAVGTAAERAADRPDLDDLALLEAADPTVPTIRLYGQGPLAGVPVVLSPAAADRPVPTALWPRDEQAQLAALLLAIALAAGCLARWSSAAGWLARQAPLVLAVASVAWWLLAPWGWLGWLGLLAASGRAWRQRRGVIRPEPLSVRGRSAGPLRRSVG